MVSIRLSTILYLVLNKILTIIQTKARMVVTKPWSIVESFLSSLNTSFKASLASSIALPNLLDSFDNFTLFLVLNNPL